MKFRFQYADDIPLKAFSGQTLISSINAALDLKRTGVYFVGELFSLPDAEHRASRDGSPTRVPLLQRPVRWCITVSCLISPFFFCLIFYSPYHTLLPYIRSCPCGFAGIISLRPRPVCIHFHPHAITNVNMRYGAFAVLSN